MADPLDGEDGSLLGPANHEGQHSLWPAAICGPADWTIAYPADSRAASLHYVEQWTEVRPLSVISAAERVPDHR